MNNFNSKKFSAGKNILHFLISPDSAAVREKLKNCFNRAKEYIGCAPKKFFSPVSESDSVDKGAAAAAKFYKIGEQEQIIFSKRLAMMIRSGVPMIAALDMLKRQTASGRSRRAIGCLRNGIERGLSLAKSSRVCGNIFAGFGANVILIGETSGTLAENLDYFAAQIRKKRELRRTVAGALVYPAFIAAATVGIVILLTIYVFPKIMPIFSSFKAGLPWSTRALIAISAAIQAYWVYFLAILAVFIFLVRVLFRIRAVRLAASRFLFKLPLLGPLFKGYCIANFCRTFGLLLKSEIGIIQSLKIAADTAENIAYGEALEKIAQNVVRGGLLSEGMEKDKLLFPPLVSQMVGAGEAAGNLESSLAYLSEMYEDEMNNSAKNLAAGIEPALMIFMGGLVGFIALSIITPIYGITQNLR